MSAGVGRCRSLVVAGCVCDALFLLVSVWESLWLPVWGGGRGFGWVGVCVCVCVFVRVRVWRCLCVDGWVCRWGARHKRDSTCVAASTPLNSFSALRVARSVSFLCFAAAYTHLALPM